MRILMSAALAACFVMSMAGCASTNPSPGPVVTVVNAFTTIQAGSAPVTLTATVSGSGKGVEWQLTLAGGSCSPACGTLTAASSNSSNSIVYTPPAVAPLNQNATITAISVADRSARFVFNFSITPGPSVTIATKFATIYAGGATVSLNANAHNDSTNSGVIWKLTAGGSNSSCSPTCGILTPGTAPTLSATYMPPASVPSGANASPTITATLAADASASDSFSFNITSANVLLKGSYAFLLRGFGVNGIPMSMAGSVTADGNGNITGGIMDVNSGGGITAVPGPLLGTYSIDPSFQNITRGTITITNFAFPGSTTNISLKFTLSSDGKSGRAVEFDGVGFRNAGTFQLQDSSALSAANPAGSYAFGLDSDAPVGGRTVEVGRFVLASTGVTGGLVDESKAGDATPRYSAAPLAAGASTAPNASGRGTMTLNVNATLTGPASTTLYAYYIVNSAQLNLLQIDSGATFGTVQAGVARIQKPLTPGSVNTTSVLQFAGMDAIPGTANGIGPDVIVGVLQISSGNFFNLTFDSNDLGKILLGHTNAGAVVFDPVLDSTTGPSTGRGVLASPGGFQNSFVSSAAFYLYDDGTGFIIDTDPSTPTGTPTDQATTNNAFSGTFTPQAASPLDAAKISGNLIFSSGASAVLAIPSIESAASFNNAALTYSAIADVSAPDPVDNLPNVTFTGTFSVVNSSLGHGTLQLPQGVYGDFSGSQLFPASFFVVGPNQFVSIGIQSGTISGISFFEPQ